MAVKRKTKKQKGKTLRRQMMLVSLLVGLIAAAAIYFACTFARCPRTLSKEQLAVAFFVLGFLISYVMKKMYFSTELKRK